MMIMRVREIRKCYVFITLMIQIVSLVCVTSRSIASDQRVSFHDPEIISPHAANHNYMVPILKPNENKEIEEMEKGRRIGSKAPNCEKKCYGCEPCEAVQVPTISSIHYLSLNYANYRPEGWRCHCSP